jgi:hypothetical protein
VGWLETAFQEGLDNLPDILASPEFDLIRKDPLFTKFTQNHSS